MEKLHPADIFESGRNKREVQFYVSDNSKKRKLDISVSGLLATIPQTVIAFQESQADV